MPAQECSNAWSVHGLHAVLRADCYSLHHPGGMFSSFPILGSQK